MGPRIRNHIRSNVVGYVALFFALSGGAAYALDGSNTVFSDDIVDDQVRSVDVRDDSLPGGGLAPADLRTGSVGTTEVANASLRGGDLVDGAVDSAKVADDSVTAPKIAPGAVGPGELQFDSVTPGKIADRAVGFPELGDIIRFQQSVSIPPNGGVGELQLNCPSGDLISGGASFPFPSGDLSASHPVFGAWFAEGQNNGTVAQDLTVYATCLQFAG